MLGLSAAEFWELTEEEFEARYERWQEQEKRWDLRFGVVASGYVNTKLKAGYPPIEPGHWFGYTDGQADNDEQFLRKMMLFAEAHNAQLGEPS